MQRAAIVLALACLACGDGTTEPTPVHPFADVLGTYDLTTVNERPLPYVVSTSPVTVTSITGGRLELRADSTYVLATTTSFANGTSTAFQTTESSGPYDVHDREITLGSSPFNPSGAPHTGFRTGSVISLQDSRGLFLLTRR
jgi:hypothetical protein